MIGISCESLHHELLTEMKNYNHVNMLYLLFVGNYAYVEFSWSKLYRVLHASNHPTDLSS